MPRRPCWEPGCRALVDRGYCEQHRRQTAARYDRQRRADPVLGQPARIRSSARWQRYRAWLKRRHPFCCDPFGKHGDRLTAAVQVHHVEPLRIRPDLAFTEANTAPVCTACHGRVEAMERTGRDTRHLFAAWRERVHTM